MSKLEKSKIKKGYKSIVNTIQMYAHKIDKVDNKVDNKVDDLEYDEEDDDEDSWFGKDFGFDKPDDKEYNLPVRYKSLSEAKKKELPKLFKIRENNKPRTFKNHNLSFKYKYHFLSALKFV